MNSLLLTGGRVIDPANGVDATSDLLIIDGKIAALGQTAATQAPPESGRLDVKGLVVCPGLIDLHVHLREPGHTSKETIDTGAAAPPGRAAARPYQCPARPNVQRVPGQPELKQAREISAKIRAWIQTRATIWAEFLRRRERSGLPQLTLRTDSLAGVSSMKGKIRTFLLASQYDDD